MLDIVKQNDVYMERLQALSSWCSAGGGLEGFSKWLADNRALSIGDRIALQLALLREIKASSPLVDRVLSEGLGTSCSFTELLTTLDFDARPRVANQICLLPPERAHVAVIGDLHADASSLIAAIRASRFFDAPAVDYETGPAGRPLLVFLGDYVDRGENHLGMLEAILALKHCYPADVVLLKGNHDGGFIENNGTVKTPYFVGEDEDRLIYFPHLMRHLELSEAEVVAPFLCEYLSFFDTLPVLCAWRSGEQTMLALHGGILRPVLFNRPLTDAEPLERIYHEGLAAVSEDLQWLPKEQWYAEILNLKALTMPSPLDEAGRSRLQNLMWSDPTEVIERMRWHTGRFKFTGEHFEAFMTHIGCDVLFRGHVVQNEGLMTYFDQRLYSVYSTGGQLLEGFNGESAYPEVRPAIVTVASGVVVKHHI